jgi:hypothetical protein
MAGISSAPLQLPLSQLGMDVSSFISSVLCCGAYALSFPQQAKAAKGTALRQQFFNSKPRPSGLAQHRSWCASRFQFIYAR